MIRLTDEGYIDDDDTSSSSNASQNSSNSSSPWLSQLPLQEREELVYKLLASMPRAHIARVHRRIAPCVQFDIIGILPTEISLLILANLSWQTLLKCALVSKRWRSLADDNNLWRILCAQRGWEWKWPTVVRSPTPLLEEDFHDEGMGDDEDMEDGGTWNATTLTFDPQAATYRTDYSVSPMATGVLPVYHGPSASRISHMNARRRISVRRTLYGYRHSAPSILPSVDAQKPNYKLLHQTHILLRNRLLHNSFRFSTLQMRGTPNSHTSIIYCLQLYTYPEDGRQTLFTGSKDCTIREWNLATGNVERVFEGVHTNSVLSLCAQGNYIASGGSDWRVCVWNIKDGRLLRTINDHQDSVLCVRFNEKHLVSCSKDRTVRVYPFPELDRHTVLGDHRAAVNAVAISGDLIVSASGDKSIRVWNAITGERLRTFDGHHTRGIASIDFQPPYIISGSSDKHIRWFDMEKMQGWSTCPDFHNPSPTATAATICRSCGGQFVEQDGGQVRDDRTARCSFGTHAVHTDLVRSVALGSEFVVSGSYDATVKVWDRETGNLIADLSGKHDGRVFCVGFDCTKVVSCGEDQKICIWDLSYGIDTSFIKM